MNKKHLIGFLIILVLVTQPVSAGFFGDMFNKITGWVTGEAAEGVTEEVVEEEATVEPEPVPEEAISEEPVIEMPAPPEPVPEEPIIEEPTTEEPIPEVPAIEEPVPVPPPEPEPEPEPKRVCCATRLVVAEPAPTVYKWMSETDCIPLMGENRGIVDNEYCEEKPEPEPKPDKRCREGDEKNHICEDGTQVPKCECRNNMWICVISPENECPEPPKPKTCAAKIKISFDKSAYAVGDPFKVEVGIFDSQGNPLPNYAFYAKMYDDRWHTPDLQKTGADGYFRASGEAQKSPSGVTKGIFNVYTKEIGSCGFVEDTTELKFKKKEPEPCGIGGCIPEPKPPKKIPGEVPEKPEIFYPCTGCELEDKCYPFGYRKGGKYCSDNYEFVAQLEEDSTCDNNFECKSNVCIDGECISGGLIKKLIKWFKKFIGRPEPPKPPKPEDEVDCSKLLIEKDIGEYEYKESGYGGFKESQAPLISDEGEQVGTIKCCAAQYLKDEKKGMAIVCPYGNREYVENLVNIGLKQSPGARFILEDYKGEKVYVDKWISMVWAHENYAIASGRAYPEEEGGPVFPEDIADAYLDKYPNDLG